jgi:hypothetical protein
MRSFWMLGLIVLTLAAAAPLPAAGVGDASPEGELIGRVQMIDLNRRVLQVGDELYRIPRDIGGLHGLRRGDVVGIRYVEENGQTRVTAIRSMESSRRKGFSTR